MLKQRVITATILLAVFLTTLLLLPHWAFQVLVLLTFAVAAWEWSNLASLVLIPLRAGYALLLLVAVWLGLDWVLSHQMQQSFFVFAAGWWALALLWVQGYPSSAIFWQNQWMRLVMGVLTLVPAGVAVLLIHGLANGQWLILSLLLVVAVADTGAYFSGKAFGRRKLAPEVSPGKTWEGVIGGLTLVAVFALIFGTVRSGPWYSALLVALPAAAISVLGDLFESMLKRHRGIKDSGTILPGHGGVLDRIDGITSAAPIFALALLVSHGGW